MGSITRKVNLIYLTKFFLNQGFRFKVLPGVLEAISFFFRQRGFDKVTSFNCSNKPLKNRRLLDIITVIYNREDLIHDQVQLLHKNLLDPFSYTVVDNSQIEEKHRLIKKVCQKERVGYIRLPRNPFNTSFFPQGSLSHGLALNWSYFNYLRPRDAKFIGIIDQDIFLVKPSSLISILNEHPLYGRILRIGNTRATDFVKEGDAVKKYIWYLWPGLFFANNNFLRGKNLNFYPGKIRGIHVDTGSMNWHALYSKMKKEEIQPTRHKFIVIGKKDPNKVTDLSDFKSNHVVEYLDNWLHMIASTWEKGIGKEKQEFFRELLNKSK